MKLTVFERSADSKGNATWRQVGTADTWRETHQYRTLRKEQRTRDGHPVASFMYDERGTLLCTP
jgi:hypothetical protein